MKTARLIFFYLVVRLSFQASAAVLYVDLNSPNPAPPYADWSSAAPNIQDAVDAAGAGDLVLVTNGVYSAGGHPVYPLTQSNRVAVTKSLTVQSVNGPEVTVIEGYHEAGAGASFRSTRCVYLTNGAALIGFTVTNGGTQPPNDQDWREQVGGGIWCESSAASVSNCVIVNCVAVVGGGAEGGTLLDCKLSANNASSSGGAADAVLERCGLTGNAAFGYYSSGGGAGNCTLNNCVLTGNASEYSGGAENCTLNNCALWNNSATYASGGAGGGTLNHCTVVGNSAGNYSGGVFECTMTDCIIYYNSAPFTPDWGFDGDGYGRINYCCLPSQPGDGVNNITNAPQLADNFHLAATSPCIGAGSTNFPGTDIDGEAWRNPPSIGCDEFYPGATGALAVSVLADYAEAVPGFVIHFTAQVTGRPSANMWDFGDGTIVSNQISAMSHSWATPGDYLVIFTAFNDDNPGGVSATTTVHVASQLIYCVDAGGTNPVAPYHSWDTAATNIQDAIDAALANAGSLVLVTNGIYQTGGRIANGSLTNRVVINKAITVQSVNGPAVTAIQGYQVPVTINDSSAVRCVYLASAGVLSGFTLTNGATLAGGDIQDGGDSSGGGVLCASANVVVTNCVLVGNSAGGFGGGVYGGVLNRCQLINNSTATGLGSYGGGAFGSTLNSCLLRGNISDIGGGAALSGLNNCTLAGNATSEVNPAFNYGGGADESVLNNCIVYGNAASSGNNYNNSTLNYCCTTPLPGSGTGNFTNAPLFVDLAGGDFHLQSSSPCINAGNNSYVTTTNDLDGNPRIQGLVVDMGAYEFPIPVAVNADYTNVVTNFLAHLSGQVVAGNVSVILLDFGDGTILTNQLSAAHSWAAPGDYAVTLTVFSDLYPGGISALVTVHVAEGNYFVALTNTNPVAPYTSWDTAATNIQDAVDVASVGGTILVSNGVYQTGERTAIEASDGSTNRLVVDRMVSIQSVNGPANTRIDGAGSFRCVYLASGAMFSGFTLTNGMSPGAGGGLLAESNSATVSNCVFIGNAGSSGGGASGGTLNDCVFLNNSASSGGGVASGVYNNCTLIGNGAWNGGGAISATLNHCVLNENHAYYSGGAESSSLNNCALTNNSGENHGGAASESVFNNCTLAGNSAFYGGGGYNVSFTNCQFITNSAGWGGAIYGGSMQSCTLTSNSAAFYGGGAMYATLDGCLILGNSTTYDGGGANSCTLNNCRLANNYTGNTGGGAVSSQINNCTLSGNSAGANGGGASYSTLNNCTLSLNSAGVSGGGAGNSTLNNCIVYYNTAPSGANFSSSTFYFSCTTPLPNSGTNNITSAPQLTDAFHISSTSPCIGAGSTNYSSGTDIDGEVWLVPPSIGCDEFYAGAVIGPLNVNLQADRTLMAVTLPVNFTASVTGRATANAWDFGDGTTASNQLFASHVWTTPGNYAVVFTAFNDDFPGGISATTAVTIVEQVVHYVSQASTNPVAPYLSWDTAATNIQDAVDAVFSAPKALVLVSNGVYRAAVVGKAVPVRSVNGPAATLIDGAATARCVSLATNSLLDGFTLTNGFTTDNGGGVFCAAANIVVSNCVFIGNSANGSGGGVFGGAIFNCTFTGNLASGNGGGAANCILNGCALTGNDASSGGGADGSMLTGSVLLDNSAYWSGGGASSSTLTGCTLADNTATGSTGSSGGGAVGSVLTDCLLASNSVAYYGGGAHSSTLNHCTLHGNAAGDYGGAFGGVLNNCTVSGNSGFYGGGVGQTTASNCVVSGNSAYGGGGASESTLVNCLIVSNAVYFEGGGAVLCTLDNCTVVKNSGVKGCGIEGCTVNNTIVSGNFINYNGDIYNYSDYVNFYGNAFNYSCTTPLPQGGRGNFTNDPAFVDAAGGDFRLQPDSPCINLGNNFLAGGATDLDGNPRIVAGTVDLGAYEFPTFIPLTVAIQAETNVLAGFAGHLQAVFGYGRSRAMIWNFGDGTVVSNQPSVVHSWIVPGDYIVTLQAFNAGNPGGVSATVTVHVVTQAIYYADAAGGNPVAPYDSWATAATTLQDATDAAAAGGTVLVNVGVYSTGGKIVGGTTNRLVVTKPVTVQAFNGGAVLIDGLGANRCAYLANGARLAGLTLTNGNVPDLGGGVFCASAGIVLSDCVVINNHSANGAGGVEGGTLQHCTVSGNNATTFAAGADAATLEDCTVADNFMGNFYGTGGGLNNCTATGCSITGNFAQGYGGGAYGGTLTRCVFTGNFAFFGAAASGSTVSHCVITNNQGDYGAGVQNCTVDNSLLAGNWAYWDGGGAYAGTLVNCTVVNNTAGAGGGSGGGGYASTFNNSIVYYNNAPAGENYSGGSLNYCDTMPWPGPGFVNFTALPFFADYFGGDFRLRADSPCIGAGYNGSVTTGTDLAGRPRISDGVVDMGAYEFQGNFSAWLDQFGLPGDGSADFADGDGDGLNNWQEWRAGTNPTNALSVLKIVAPVSTDISGGITVTWQSVAGMTYFIDRSTDLSATPAFINIQGGIIGQEGTTSWLDTNATGGSSFFYRVGVQ